MSCLLRISKGEFSTPNLVVYDPRQNAIRISSELDILRQVSAVSHRAMTSDQGGVDGCVAVGVARIDLSRCGDQNFDSLQVAVAAGEVQRRVIVRQQAFVDDGSVGLSVGEKREAEENDAGGVLYVGCDNIHRGTVSFLLHSFVGRERGVVPRFGSAAVKDKT